MLVELTLMLPPVAPGSLGVVTDIVFVLAVKELVGVILMLKFEFAELMVFSTVVVEETKCRKDYIICKNSLLS